MARLFIYILLLYSIVCNANNYLIENCNSNNFQNIDGNYRFDYLIDFDDNIVINNIKINVVSMCPNIIYYFPHYKDFHDCYNPNSFHSYNIYKCSSYISLL